MLIESRDLEPGFVVRNKYRIVRVLGRGGMGTVYLAEHILLGRKRALKFMSAELSQDARFLKRFRLEALATIELHHQNIVGVVDLDQAEDGSPFIAMEYVDGQSLREALADAPFPVEQALSIARGVGLGLIMAHSRNIIHRDIKPENILLAQEAGKPEVPKILDFGIAAMRQSATAISRTRGVLLTPEYAAPEQWKGMPAEELDGRVDIYALGGVLHEMLTGSTSLQAHNTEGWMYQHLQVPPEAPSRLRPELAGWNGLDELVLRMLEKDREHRTASAEEFVRELDAVRSGKPISAARAKTVLEPVAPLPPVLIQPEERVIPQATAPAAPQPGPIVHSMSRSVTQFVIAATVILAIGIGAGWLLFHERRTQVPGSPTSESSKAPANTGAQPTTPPVAADSGNDDARKGMELYDAKRYDEAFPLVKRAAESGHARSQSALGWMYDNGKGVAQDYTQAVYWFRKAADQGDAHGESNLGVMYENGQAVKQDYAQAVSWYRKAADQGAAYAEAHLGSMYQHGRGVAQDYGQAVSWYRKSADQGDAGGEGDLGYMYEWGRGVAQDYEQALKWYRAAAEGGDASAMNNIGYMYEHGEGVKKDYAQALNWYRQAAEHGDDTAMNNLGWMYQNGEGVAKDVDQAVSWYRKAAALGNESAKKNLQRLGK
jgi:TPR repeat protein/serine/threonine protein kinase